MSIEGSNEVVKKVDEAWKDKVDREKLQPAEPAPKTAQPSVQESPEPALAAAKPAGQERSGQRPKPGRPSQEVPQTEFTFFLSSLSMQAMIALGEMPHPATNQPQEDLEQARYLIDVVGMLQEKTKGNLSPEESELMENLLYELRTRYVSRMEAAQGPAGRMP